MPATAEMNARGEQNRRKWRSRLRPTDKSLIVREPNGRKQRDSKDETQAQIKATVLNQPHRRHLKEDKKRDKDGCSGPGDERAAYAFGRLRLSGELTKVQHDALVHWLDVFVRYSRAIGLPSVHYGNCLAANVGGSFAGDDPDPAASASRANKAKRAFEDLEQALGEGMGTATTEANVALVHVCVMDRDPSHGMLGVLRAAANIIDRNLTRHARKPVDGD